MVPADIRARLVYDHVRLLGKMEVLEGIALRILRGDEDLGSALRLKGEEIQDHLVRHMNWEEEQLLPLLRDTGRADIANKLAADHAAQRERINDALITLQGPERRPVALARHMLEFLRSIERDIRDEESEALAALGAAPEPRSRSHRH